MTALAYGAIMGRVVRMQREVRGVSLEAMAKALGYKDSSGWSRVETGDTEMTVTTLWRAADRLGTSSAALVKMADDLTEDLARERR